MLGMYLLIWFLLIIACGSKLLIGIWRVLKRKPDASVLFSIVLPALLLTFFTWPMSGSPLMKNISCSMAGLKLSPPIEASSEGVYWKPTSSLEGRLLEPPGGFPSLKENLLRALVEGRVAYLELPDGVSREGKYAGMVRYKKLFMKPLDINISEPLKNCYDKRLWSTMSATSLPSHFCIAVDDIREPSARFELTVSKPAIGPDYSVRLRDLKQDKLLAVAGYAAMHKDPLMPNLISTASCTREKTDYRLLTFLPLMQFAAMDGKSVQRHEIDEFRKSAWNVQPPKISVEPVPDGEAGISYLLAKGDIREMTFADMDLWKRAVKQSKRYGKYEADQKVYGFHRVYLVMKPIRSPAGLAGAHSVSWILLPGIPIPSGELGHSSVYRVDEGCLISVRCN